MAASRRFTTDIGPEHSAFARTVLLEAWRALLPDTLDLAEPLRLRDRLRLGRAERVVLTGTFDLDADTAVAAGALELLWHHHASNAAVSTTPTSVGVSVSAGVGLGLGVDDLAAAVTAVAGEQGAASITVFRLDERDADRSKELVRAFRRVSVLPVSLVAHDLSTDVTAEQIADCALFVTVDRTAANVARSMGVRTIDLGAHDDLTELYVALHAPTDTPGGIDAHTARAVAFALDAWHRDRMSTEEMRASMRPVDTSDDLVAA